MSATDQVQQGNFSWKRISIAALLFLTFCLAGAFTGFRFGFQAGLSQSLDSRVDELFKQRDKIPFVKTYPVKDLMVTSFNVQDPMASKFALIVGDIEHNVCPAKWEANGGPCKMQPYFQNNSLVISASGSVHDQIVGYLQGRRLALQQSQ